ncbi:MAG: Ig-like domain-containing protein [Lachnospiraceae bacterium]|nr:Ig-like domain-containing protein [Lachnospiraceae bacterium]
MKKNFLAAILLTAGVLVNGCALRSAVADIATTADTMTSTQVETTQDETTQEATTKAPVVLEDLVFVNQSVTVKYGETVNLASKLRTVPEDSEVFEPITWESSDESVATVDGAGTVTPVSSGSACVYARSGDIEAAILVNVYVELTGVSANDAQVNYSEEAVYALEWSLLPAQPTTHYKPIFTSSDESVLTVDADGNIYTKGLGQAQVRVKAGSYEAVANINVNLHATDIVLNTEYIEMYRGTAAQLATALFPANTTDTLGEVTFTSADENIAVVGADGVVTAVSSGTTTITVSANGFSKQCTIFVPVELSGISYAEPSIVLIKGAQGQGTIVASPADCNEQYTLLYASDNPAVASVDANGVITAVGAGTCNIVAAAKDFTTFTTVTVLSPLQGIYLNYSDVTIYTGNLLQLGVGFLPADTTDDRTITWASSDPNVATVDANGLVKGISRGSCIIGAYCGGAYAGCTVNVFPQAGLSTPNAAGNYVVVLDPGHGGGDGGAVSAFTGALEKNLNLMVALYCREYLLTHYSNVEVYMTREGDYRFYENNRTADLTARVNVGLNVGANIFVSFHFNSAGNGAGGSMVLISKQANVYNQCAALGNNILVQLAGLGIRSNGLVMRNSDSNPALDYYFINRQCAAYGLPGIIIEHCFLDCACDVPFYDGADDYVRLGYADAIGIANYLGLAAK